MGRRDGAPPVAAGAPRSAAPRRLTEAVEAVAGVVDTSWADEPASTMAGALSEVERLRSLADAAELEVLAAFDASGEHTTEGHGSPAGWLQHHCRSRRSTAVRRVRLSRRLRDMPGTRRALAAGEISVEHAEVLAKATRTPVLAAAFAEAEDQLVDHARTMRFVAFARAVRYFMVVADRAGAEGEADHQAQRRAMHASQTFDGMGRVDGWMTPTAFAEWKAELDRIERQLWADDWAEARQRLGDAARSGDLRRTAGQRRHDATVEMARRSAGADGPAPAATCLNLHLDWATACAELARMEGGGDVAVTGEQLCELEDGTVIPASTALSAALAGHLRRVVFGPHGTIVDHGRTRRFFTPAQREAVIAANRTCAHPFGCDRPARTCHMDHIVEYADAGPTNLSNADPECPPHNLYKTNHKHDPPSPHPGHDPHDDGPAPP